MADKSLRVIVGSLGAFGRHGGRGQLDRFANSDVAGFAAVHNIGVRDIDLLDPRTKVFRLLFQACDLGGREVDHVIVHVLVQSWLGLRHGFQSVTQFRIQLGALIFELVVCFFQLREVVLLLAAIGKFDGPQSLAYICRGLSECSVSRRRWNWFQSGR